MSSDKIAGIEKQHLTLAKTSVPYQRMFSVTALLRSLSAYSQMKQNYTPLK